MVVDDLCALLSGSSGCGTSAVDLWAYEMPDTDGVADLASVLTEYAAAPSESKFGAAGVFREVPRVQVLTRSNVRDAASGRLRIETIRNVLGAVNWPTTINGVAYWNVKLLNSPFWLRRDEKWRHYFVFNIELYKDPAP